MEGVPEYFRIYSILVWMFPYYLVLTSMEEYGIVWKMAKVDLLDPKNWINPETGKRYRWFNRDGEGYADGLDWAKDFKPPKDGRKRRKWERTVKVVKQETTWLGFWVSTVWLGLDYQFLSGPPLIFETMVFFRSWSDLDQHMYTTEEQALAGHKQMVKKWSNPFLVARELISDRTWHLRYKIKRWLK